MKILGSLVDPIPITQEVFGVYKIKEARKQNKFTHAFSQKRIVKYRLCPNLRTKAKKTDSCKLGTGYSL